LDSKKNEIKFNLWKLHSKWQFWTVPKKNIQGILGIKRVPLEDVGNNVFSFSLKMETYEELIRKKLMQRKLEREFLKINVNDQPYAKIIGIDMLWLSISTIDGYGHGIMSQHDQAVSAFFECFWKKNYVTWILKIDFECLGKEMFI
jgi:hypothetical protein